MQASAYPGTADFAEKDYLPTRKGAFSGTSVHNGLRKKKK